MITTKFWGVIIQPRSSFTFTPPRPLELRNATIQTRNDTFAETVLVLGVPSTNSSSSGTDLFNVTVLQAPHSQQAHFTVALDAGIQYTLSAMGPNSIAVLGMYTAESVRNSSSDRPDTEVHDSFNIPASSSSAMHEDTQNVIYPTMSAGTGAMRIVTPPFSQRHVLKRSYDEEEDFTPQAKRLRHEPDV
ncbi:hypothetical protein EV360DRAFT_69081 [Lentinula raphanica]|nr:hypothetical protein EV360DRAFT_69081 [Lentinula raphanica]